MYNLVPKVRFGHADALFVVPKEDFGNQMEGFVVRS